MATWTKTGNISGPVGPRGDQGVQGVPGLQGVQGAVGPSITMQGSVATSGNLPPSGNTQGDAYIVQADDSLWLWDGTQWVSGGSIQGPQGAQGVQGAQGIQGSQGNQGNQGTVGPPGAVAVSAQPEAPVPHLGALWVDTDATPAYGPQWLKLTQAAYDALPVKDPDVLYLVT